VILSTHILQEVEAVCSRVLILNEGRIAAQGSPEEIAGTMKGGDTWDLSLKGVDVMGVQERIVRLARQGEELSALSVTAEDAGTVEVSFFLGSRTPGGASRQDGDDGERIFDWAVAEGLKILRMNRKRLSLEDIFVKLTSESPADAEAAVERPDARGGWGL
jgi:ABC-2 type transport system ATP-binding protein